MTAHELRQSFLDFFKEKQHTVVPSASLMPTSPNLLFTNAGMNQFVPFFLGEQTPPYKRAADTQKCIRAGGKHNDLDDVGFDTYHHTFFEMLGNWSFGDFFKQEAIHWAWELLTKRWNFPKERLYATVYKPSEGDPASFDQQAYDIWKELLTQEGLDPEIHIVYGDKKDNFWMMGDTGPCGPCTEIHMDLTPEGNTQGKLVNADNGRCIELWNLVFIQFNAEADGSFKDLAQQHVDTGMGLERVAGILATTKNFTDFSPEPSNYDSDLFTPIFNKITELSGISYKATLGQSRTNMSEDERNDCAFRVLGDHIRTLSFSIADGILPGNEGRNYVLRRILRRAVLFGQHLKLPQGFFAQLVNPLIECMKDAFPELEQQRELIHRVIQSEEAAFDRTLSRGLQLLDKIANESGAISGEDAFTLYDTYGFPIDLTELIAAERGLSIDIDGFNQKMEEQRNRARAAQKKTIISVQDNTQGDSDQPATIFTGYDMDNLTAFKSRVVDAFEDEDNLCIILDKTPFYATMGGQVADTGIIEISGNNLQVTDVQKDAHERFIHKTTKGAAEASSLIGHEATSSVSIAKRLSIQRNHTATHLLHWALRKHLGTHVQQAGSLVDDKHLRFDFSHFEAPSAEVLTQIENSINEKILENTAVISSEVPFSEKPENCIAFFGEKYGELVRVVDIGGFSVELCGGTHVKRIGEIGFIKITNESAIAAGTRRIEAICATKAFNLAQQLHAQEHNLAKKLSCTPAELPERIESLKAENADLKKQLRKFEQQASAAQGDKLIDQAQLHEGISWIIAPVQAPNPNELRGMAVSLSKKLGPSAIVLAAAFGEKVTTLALCSPEAIEKGFTAGSLVKALSEQLGGKGGGKPDYAMGGGKNSDNFTATVSNFKPYNQAKC